MRVGRRLLAETNLTHATLSSDALHSPFDTARETLLSGGEMVVQIKGNQKGMLNTAERLAAAPSPFLP